MFKLQPMFMRSCLFFLILGGVSVTHGADLMDVYRQSLDNDPTFKAAFSTYQSQSESLPQAWAALLPQLSVNAQASRNEEEVHSFAIDLQQPYGSNLWQISASQAVFNYQAWSQVQQAKASVKASLAIFNNAAQDLILRSSSAYFDLLFAHDTLSFAEAKKRANKHQLDQAQQRFNVGLDAITSVYEAQAAFDQSVAEVISAKNNLVNQSENLSKLTNHVYEHVAVLRDSKIPLMKPEPNNVDDWVTTGLRQNYNLFAAKYSLQAARENIKAQTAKNLPTFAIQGTTTTTHNDAGPNSTGASGVPNNFASSIFIPAKQVSSSVAITMNLPIIEGGLVLSQTRQAKFDFQTASEQLEKVYRDVVTNSRIAFNTIIDGISKVLADRQTVVSQKNSLDSVYAQYEVGTRTMTDVVNAQQRLFQAQNQLAGDQYALIKSLLNLKYLAGTLNVTDVEEINSWLSTARIDAMVPNNTHHSEEA
jgi:outer membrane protein